VGNLLHHRRDSLRPPSPLFKRSHSTASITTIVNKDAKVLNLPTLETYSQQNRNTTVKMVTTAFLRSTRVIAPLRAGIANMSGVRAKHTLPELPYGYDVS
jgi:hypothetical protein